MKIKLYVLLGMTAIAIHGCTKREDPIPYMEDTSPVFYAYIYPTEYKWSALNSRTTAVMQNGTLNLTGVARDSNMITITINSSLEDSISYNLGYGSVNTGAYSQGTNIGIPSWSTNGDPACTGTFKLTKLDTINKLISGSFRFYAYRSTDNSFRTIVGAFNYLKYSIQ